MIFFIIKQALNHLYSDNYIVFKKKLVRLPCILYIDNTLILSLLLFIQNNLSFFYNLFCSSTQPKEANLSYPNPELMKNPHYYDGYAKKAKKIKQGKVWTNWGIAFGVNLIAALLLLSSSSAQ
ncbi:hypothetical protein [Flavobacterium sp.]|uniref:hypothetical protein n=1 Tax=Flavobacterium sp. TaxID=239 RepID=UPI003752FD3A